jgi:hypothetical protein
MMLNHTQRLLKHLQIRKISSSTASRPVFGSSQCLDLPHCREHGRTFPDVPLQCWPAFRCDGGGVVVVVVVVVVVGGGQLYW